MKQVRLPSNKRSLVLGRLQNILKNPPPHVHPIAGWGLLPSGALLYWQDILSGEPINQWTKGHRTLEQCQTLAHQIQNLAWLWKAHDFVHGDINGFNLIVTDQGLMAVDWLLDLESHIGTPAFAHPLVSQGKHTYVTDRYALRLLSSQISLGLRAKC